MRRRGNRDEDKADGGFGSIDSRSNPNLRTGPVRSVGYDTLSSPRPERLQPAGDGNYTMGRQQLGDPLD